MGEILESFSVHGERVRDRVDGGIVRPVLENFTQRDFGDFGESDLTKYLKGGGMRGKPMGKRTRTPPCVF
jgi:hypothetical protein